MSGDAIYWTGAISLMFGLGLLGYWYAMMRPIGNELLDEFKDL
jgi:hypothetical protein